MPKTGLAFRRVARVAAALLLSAVAAVVRPLPAAAQADEFRAFWVDAFHAGFKNSTQVATLISNLRDANCNAVVVELRKRGDAYYTPDATYADYEPHATDTSPSDFDSLADLIAKAHDTSGGKRRIEVHVWLVTWPIWGSTTAPANPQHPYNRHPEWLTQDTTGATWNNQNYCFDPAHPGAFEHTYRIAINLVTNYDIDGINFDYVRYAGNTWGYNPTAVARFRARYGGSGNPPNTDPNWLQFRRDQVTGFVRKVYLNTIATKPNVKVSADTITWAPGPANLSGWYASAAWTSVLQDWRGWTEEGILDLNIPMAYFDLAGNYTRDWTNWCNFIRDYQYRRQAVIGPGVYLNATAGAIAELRYTRTASPAGNFVRGVCGYSYAVPDKTTTPFATFLTYLTNSPNAYDSLTPAVFSQPASVPAMPWKTAPTNGHLMGTVFAGGTGNPADGAVVTVSGPAAARSQTNDSSGFFGFVDLPPGTYAVRAGMAGLAPATNTVTVSAGGVTNVNLILSVNDLIIDNPAATVIGSWSTGTSAIGRYGTDYGYKTQGSGSNYLQYTPNILAAGKYALYEWHPAGGNGTTNASFLVHFAGGDQSVYMNQQANGGAWNLVGTFNFAAGTGGYIRITDGFADAGQVVFADALKLVYLPPWGAPSILAQPRSRAAVPGGSASFSVIASSSTPLRYQWRFNGSDCLNQTNPALSLPAVQAADFGSYTVLVSNDAGSRLSDPAVLTPANLPALTATLLNETGLNVSFMTESGPSYSLEQASMQAGAPWQTLTNIVGNGSGVTISNNLSFGPARFYRVRVY